MLIGQFWGTSAAEGIPAPFCTCDVCNEAREKGGKHMRMRSCFRLSDKIMIDLGADAVCQARLYGNISEVEHVFITHTHDDHLNVHMLMEAFWSRMMRKTLHYYFTDKAFNITKCWKENKWILKGMVEKYEQENVIAFHKLEYGMRTVIGDIALTPFRGNHPGNMGENSAMYLAELPDGRKLFYGLDSGVYFHETFEALKEHHIDIFISEATGGTQVWDGTKQHMCLSDVLTVMNKLYEQGTLSDRSVAYLTHINHSTSHDDVVKAVENMGFPIPVTVAWDGLKIF